MTNFLNPVSLLSVVLALMMCAAAIRYVLRFERDKRSLGVELSIAAAAARDERSQSARRVVALSATGVSTGAAIRAAERHALHIGALRVPVLSGRSRRFDFSQLPLSDVYRRPGLSRVSSRAERRLVVVR